MERNAQEESKAHLMATSEEYRQACQPTLEISRGSWTIWNRFPHLTEEQQLEETRLKKFKLRLKDQMEAMVSHNRAQPVA